MRTLTYIMKALAGAAPIVALILSLYLLYSWVQFIVGDEPWFINSLGMYSPLVVLIGYIGLILLAVVIDLVVLTALALAAKPSLSKLSGLVWRVVPLSLVTGFIASLTYSTLLINSPINQHPIGLAGFMVTAAQVVSAALVMALAIKGGLQLRLRELLLLTYLAALISGYLVDSACATALLMLRGIEPVIGAYGLLDGLVLNQAMTMAYTALAHRLALMQRTPRFTRR